MMRKRSALQTIALGKCKRSFEVYNETTTK